LYSQSFNESITGITHIYKAVVGLPNPGERVQKRVRNRVEEFRR
jgi:hypothetical protein